VGLSEAAAAEVHRRVRAGETQAVAAAAVGCCEMTVGRLLNRAGGMAPRQRPRAPWRLSVAEREEISRGVRAHDSCRTIARRLGRAPSTVSRELAGNGGAARYRAWRAEGRASGRARRPKPSKLAQCARLRVAVEQQLAARWSPQQIAARLVRDYPNAPEMRVSHETIYRSLFVQTRGALRRELTQHLRRRRPRRQPARTPRGGALRDMVLVSQRPAAVADRAVPGHWEGDLIIGKRGASAIGTLVERTTRYVMLLHLGGGRSAANVRVQLAKTILQLPTHLRRSLTWDRGKEMGEHVSFTVETGVQVYFCDPHSPWQRGSNENTNGLLRQYFPKGTDLSVHTAAHLDAVAVQLNGRPRQTLDWLTPSEAFARLLR